MEARRNPRGDQDKGSDVFWKKILQTTSTVLLFLDKALGVMFPGTFPGQKRANEQTMMKPPDAFSSQL